MANTYTWSINSMSCYPTYASQTDVVFQVGWTCTGASADTPPLTASITNVADIVYNPNDPFIPYPQLTENVVIEWVQTTLTPDGVTAVQTTIDAGITSQSNPPIVTPPLPWNTPTT